MQSCAAQLTRLHTQPHWGWPAQWPWALLPSLPRLRELSIGLSPASEQLCSRLTALHTLALAFAEELRPDLSALTGLRQLSLFGCGQGEFRGRLPASITCLCMRNAVAR